VVYERAWSTAPWTLPAHASLFTGKHPTSHAAHFDERNGTLHVQGELARQRGVAFRVNPLHESETTLAELARDAGYATAAFVGGPWLAPEFGVVQGFERVDARAQGRAGVPADVLSEAALAWLAEVPRERPLLLFVNYFDPHAPYSPPEAYRRLVAEPEDAATRSAESPGARRRRELRERYDGEIRFMDHQLGRLLDGLAQHGRYRDALIVVTADHGELFGEHGQLGHRHWLYEELLRVPLVVRHPGGRGGGTRSEQPLSLVDLLPLISRVAELPLPPDVEGVAPGERRLVLGESHRDALSIARDPAFDRDLFAAIRWPWKLVLDDRGEASLYRLDRDPREQNDLRGAPEETALREALAAARAALRPPARAPQAPRAPSDEALRRLRALGYLE
jgi:arylsulfatase A-like enzyme